jgi:hypothetical protein
MFFRKREAKQPAQRSPLEDAGGYSAGAEEIVPFEARGSERVIPIQPNDLDRFIISDPRHAPSERAMWEQFCNLLAATFHHEYLGWLKSLKDLYAPLDPDSESVAIDRGTRAVTDASDEAFLQPFDAAMTRANYQKLKMTEVRRAIEAPNERGLNYEPNFELFEHLAVYARGRTQVPRTIRSVGTGFRRRTISLAAFQRLVVALKFKPDRDLGPFARPDVVYLRLFKDVPFVDMEMHLPEQGTRVRMRTIDKAQIASPLLIGLPAFALKILTTAIISPIALGGVLIAPLTAGVNSIFGFQRAKQRHLHHMIRNLYYLTLANNASVLSCVVDSAAEEEYKESLLAYYCLWKARGEAEAWNAKRLDEVIERLVLEACGAEIDFEIGDALNKLVRLGLVHRDAANVLHAVPLDHALAILDEQWDDLFRLRRHARTDGEKLTIVKQ